MRDLSEVKAILDEINSVISGYDPVLKEQARDLLLKHAFAAEEGAASPAEPVEPAGEGPGEADSPASSPPAPQAASRPRRRRTSQRVEFSEMVARWTPQSAAEKALLGAYYLSEVKRNRKITSQMVNAELKNAGLSVSNITRALDANVNASPPRLVQVRKMGTTQQARKQYRITPEGIQAVEERLASPGEEA